MPAAHARVDLGLGDQRHVGGGAGHQPHGHVHQRVVEDHQRAELGEQLAHGRVESSASCARRPAACTTAPWRTSTGSEGMKR